MSNCEFFYFPIGILGQVWYLIVSIPDQRCHLHMLCVYVATICSPKGFFGLRRGGARRIVKAED